MNYSPRLYGFWDRIEQACQDAGMSKAEAARRAGIDRKSLYSNKGSMNASTLARFCAATKADANWLLLGGVKPDEYLNHRRSDSLAGYIVLRWRDV